MCFVVWGGKDWILLKRWLYASMFSPNLVVAKWRLWILAFPHTHTHTLHTAITCSPVLVCEVEVEIDGRCYLYYLECFLTVVEPVSASMFGIWSCKILCPRVSRLEEIELTSSVRFLNFVICDGETHVGFSYIWFNRKMIWNVPYSLWVVDDLIEKIGFLVLLWEFPIVWSLNVVIGFNCLTSAYSDPWLSFVVECSCFSCVICFEDLVIGSTKFWRLWMEWMQYVWSFSYELDFSSCCICKEDLACLCIFSCTVIRPPIFTGDIKTRRCESISSLRKPSFSLYVVEADSRQLVSEIVDTATYRPT